MSNVHIINVAQTPTSLSEKVNPMSIAFQKSTKEVEKISQSIVCFNKADVFFLCCLKLKSTPIYFDRVPIEQHELIF